MQGQSFMGCVSSLSVTTVPQPSYWGALIEFMSLRQQKGRIDDSHVRVADVKEYADSGIAAALDVADAKAKFSDQDIEDCGYLGWLACAY